jgi:penicillin-binding protein 2
MNREYRIIYNRGYKIFICFIIFLSIILFYLWYLQIYNYDFFVKKSIANFTRFKTVNSIRGSIIDRKGFTLASTEIFFQLLWNKKPYKLSEEDNKLLFFIENSLGIKVSYDDLIKRNGLHTVIIENDFKFIHLSMLLENFPTSDRIIIKKCNKRIYPYNMLACHTIGYLNSIHQDGITGIEKICNENLEGVNGTEKVIVNSTGNIISSETVDESKAGRDIMVTLDYTMQSLLEQTITEDISGCALIMEPDTGALRAVVSSPRFDPSLFLHKIDSDTWNNFSHNKNLLNRCFQALYPPGSIFKMVTAVALLEENISNKYKTWFCNGAIEYKGRQYHCNLKKGHGEMNLRRAVCHSCNIPFYSVAMDNTIAIDTLYKYASLLGLGKKTNSKFFEQQGIVPNSQWKRDTYNEKWYTGETLSVTIGQGPTLVSPIQVARLMGAIMTGYLVKPRILEEELIEKNYIPIHSETLAAIKEAISQGVKEGSSITLKSLSQWDIYAKTGTSQVCALPTEENKNQEVIKERRHHGIIACYVKHKYKPINPFVLVLVLENIGTSRVAAAYAKKFLLEFQKTI